MFDMEPYKHPDHKSRRAQNLSIDELCKNYPEERTLPYFSISVEQIEADKGFLSMHSEFKGRFLLLLPILWRANGLLQDYSKAIAKNIGITKEIWETSREVYIGLDLLEVSPDSVYLLNRGFRQQYLNALEKSNNRRKKSEFKPDIKW